MQVNFGNGLVCLNGKTYINPNNVAKIEQTEKNGSKITTADWKEENTPYAASEVAAACINAQAKGTIVNMPKANSAVTNSQNVTKQVLSAIKTNSHKVADAINIPLGEDGPLLGVAF